MKSSSINSLCLSWKNHIQEGSAKIRQLPQKIVLAAQTALKGLGCCCPIPPKQRPMPPLATQPLAPPTNKDTPFVPSTTDHGHAFFYLNPVDVQRVGMIKKETYKDAVTNLPIACVDVFLYNPANRTYLLVLRKDPPAKGVWWLPGGRLYKGETFFSCSVRKCKEEVGLDATPVKTLGFVATLFPDSMWNTQTHTVNFLVLAKVNAQGEGPKIDKTCENYQWVPLETKPSDPYVLKAYNKALKILAS